MTEPDKKHPPLCLDAELGPKACRGFQILMCWLSGDEISAIELRAFTCEADIAAARKRHGTWLIEKLRQRPGMFDQFVAMHDAEQARLAMDVICQ